MARIINATEAKIIPSMWRVFYCLLSYPQFSYTLAGHATCVTGTRQGASNNHSVVAGKYAEKICLITFSQWFHDQRLLERWATQILTFLVPACPA
jgi:hypothetical protein